MFFFLFLLEGSGSVPLTNGSYTGLWVDYTYSTFRVFYLCDRVSCCFESKIISLFLIYIIRRLVSGLLQLPKGTHLILDETAMTDGQLSAKGVQNLTSLGN